jgi:hypothetical protein
MSKYGDGYVPANGKSVTFNECAVCGDIYVSTGHSTAGDASDTQHHKDVIAVNERASK